jgi:hypothetical protein
MTISLTFSNASTYTAELTQVVTPPVTPRFRFAWDDEIDVPYNYQCRTLLGGFDSDNPPAVLRFYPLPGKVDAGDFRVNLTKDPSWQWRDTIIQENGGGEVGERAFNYLIGSSRAQFNTTGWAQMAYLGMCGNEVNVLERAVGWTRIETLKPRDWLRARSMSRATHPTLIHSFHCVTWDRETQTTKHILSTGTPRGLVYYPVVSWEGYAWIPSRFVVPL